MKTSHSLIGGMKIAETMAPNLANIRNMFRSMIMIFFFMLKDERLLWFSLLRKKSEGPTNEMRIEAMNSCALPFNTKRASP